MTTTGGSKLSGQSWGGKEDKTMKKARTTRKKAKVGNKFDRDYYRNLIQQPRDTYFPIRIAYVGKENTAKTGLAIDMALSVLPEGKELVILDIDNSAQQTVSTHYADRTDIRVIPIFDEGDQSIFNSDNTTNWTALVDKMAWFMNILGEEIKDGVVGSVLLDGCSTLLKWCEFAMTDVLMNRSKNPINVEDGDRFNQAEWRVRNKLFRDIVNRAHQLRVQFVGFTFHLKDVKEFMDIGNGQKGLMKVGETPEWENGTKRLFSQQIWLTRHSKEGDMAAGVKADHSLTDGQWVVRASINEMKGRHHEYLGTTHDILNIKDGKATWFGLPFLTWQNGNGEKDNGSGE